MDVKYTADAVSSGGGRDGVVRSDDGFIDLEVKMPPALGGPGGATNPEQLFAAAYATCFHGALRMVARGARVQVPEGTTIEAQVGIGMAEGGFGLAATIIATIPGLDQAVADDLVAKAHQGCPYSKATRGNMDVTLIAKV